MKAYRTGQGNWQLNYTLDDGKRRTLSLGRNYTAGAAERTAKVVRELVLFRKIGEPVPTDLLHRVGQLPFRIRTGLERGGLVECGFGLSAGDLWERFLESKSHLKKTTTSSYCDARKHFFRYFPQERSTATISQTDAETFVAALGKTLKPSTVSRMFRRFQEVLEFAKEKGFLQNNPFDFPVERIDTDEARLNYIAPETIRRVLNHCRNDHERLAIALGRFAGLRVPSELLGLRFGDFGKEVIRIAEDTKTGFREVPLLGEVREIFNRLSGTPDELVFRRSKGWCRGFFVRAIERSGEKQWTKLWTNLRSSCITDFFGMGYDEKTLDLIFGNTAAVRKKYYIQFNKQRAYARVLADGDKIFSGKQISELAYQELLPLLREFLESRQ